MLLAIDTSAGTDVALVDGSSREVLAEFREPNPRHHAEVIGVGIEAVLRDADRAADDVTEVVCGMGPGPFTGLRVGVAAARTFAFARGVPLRPMPSHDAIAREWRAMHPDHAGAITVLTDARRRELACTRYSAGAFEGEPFVLVSPGDVDAVIDGAARVDADQVSAAQLAFAWCERRERGIAAASDEILYSRAPDAKPGAVPKRVSGS